MYRGGANTAFLRLVNGPAVIGGKLQFCANHATEALEYVDTKMIKVSEGETFYDYPSSLACSYCGGDLGDSPFGFFGNTYFRGMSERQYYGQICPDCVDQVAADLHLGAARQ